MFNLKRIAHLGNRISYDQQIETEGEILVCEDNCMPAMNFTEGNTVFVGFV